MIDNEVKDLLRRKDSTYLESIDDLRELLETIDDGTLVTVTLETGDNND